MYLSALGLALIALLPATASTSKGDAAMAASDKNPSPYRKVEVNATEVETIRQLRALGARELSPPQQSTVSWGITLWDVPVHQMSLLAARPNLKIMDEYDLVGANGIYFYPQLGEPPIPDNLRQTKRDGYQMWLVKYDQPYNHNTTRKWLAAHDIKFIDGATTKTSFLLWVDEKQLAEVEAAVNPNGPILWAGPYHPYYRMDTGLRNLVLTGKLDQYVKVEVALPKHENVSYSLDKIKVLARDGEILMNYSLTPLDVVGYAVEVKVADLITLANFYDVMLILPWAADIMADEIQGQLIAGNITGSSNVGPSGPGYLNWLTSKGFVNNPNAYPIVALADSGIDNGTTSPQHPDFYQLGLANPAASYNFNS